MKVEGLFFVDLKGVVFMVGVYDMVVYYNIYVEVNGKEMVDSYVLGVFGELDDVK